MRLAHVSPRTRDQKLGTAGRCSARDRTPGLLDSQSLSRQTTASRFTARPAPTPSWPDILVPGPPSPSGQPQTPVRLACVSPRTGAQGLGTFGSRASGWRQPGARVSRLPLLMGLNRWSLGQPVPEPTDDSLPLYGMAGPQATRGCTPLFWIAVPEPPEVRPGGRCG